MRRIPYEKPQTQRDNQDNDWTLPTALIISSLKVNSNNFTTVESSMRQLMKLVLQA